MRLNKQNRLQLRIQSIVFLVLFLCSISLLAWLSHQHNIRSDWTINQRNSLSESSIKLLKTLKQPVIIRSYQAADEGAVKAVTEILQNYQRVKSNLTFRVLNPDLDIELAKADKIERYGQSIIKYNHQQATIDNLSEQKITNALLRLSREKPPLIAFINNHGERDINNKNNTGYLKLAEQLRNKGFNLQNLNLLTDQLNHDIKVVVIAGSDKIWLKGEQKKLQQYLQQGGNLLWLQDPAGTHSLNTLRQTLDINFVNGVVVDTDANLRKTLGIQHPAVVPIIKYGDHAITRQIRYNTLFPIASAITAKDETHWIHTPLLISLASSWSDTNAFDLALSFDAKSGDKQGPLFLGMALHADKNNKQQRIVVIGDSDFLANSYVGAGANLLLGLNIMNWLSEDDELINIAPKNAPDLSLKLNDTELLFISFGFLIVLPLLLLISGIFIWRQRKNKS